MGHSVDSGREMMPNTPPIESALLTEFSTSYDVQDMKLRSGKR